MGSVAERKPRGARSKVERFEVRVSAEAKALCQTAARLQGRTLPDFVAQSAFEAAQRTVRENEFLELSQRDRTKLVTALLNPPAPNPRLRKAARRYRQTLG
jgi:uncharacterized protein (DUF1778 family)